MFVCVLCDGGESLVSIFGQEWQLDFLSSITMTKQLKEMEGGGRICRWKAGSAGDYSGGCEVLYGKPKSGGVL